MGRVFNLKDLATELETTNDVVRTILLDLGATYDIKGQQFVFSAAVAEQVRVQFFAAGHDRFRRVGRKRPRAAARVAVAG